MYDIIGDIHSCYYELEELLIQLGYTHDDMFSFKPPEGRQVVLVGDITDRGWHPHAVFCTVETMMREGSLVMAKGNHDDKLQRWAKGNNVQLLHGLDATVEKLEKAGVHKERILDLFNSTPQFLILDDGKLVIAHAAWKDRYKDIDPFSKRCRSWCLFGPTTGKVINGLPDRIDWAIKREVGKDSPIIVHGHSPVREVRVVNKVWNVDTGCAFGGKLTALRYPEMELIHSNAMHTYCQRERWGYGEKT